MAAVIWPFPIMPKSSSSALYHLRHNDWPGVQSTANKFHFTSVVINSGFDVAWSKFGVGDATSDFVYFVT